MLFFIHIPEILIQNSNFFCFIIIHRSGHYGLKLQFKAENASMVKEDDLTDALEILRAYSPYNTTLGCLVLLFNSFILYFYHKKYRKFVPCMYSLLALFDCLMTLFKIISYLIALSFQGQPSEYVLQRKWVLVGFKLGGKFFLKLSIFISTLLSVARTIKTVRPFSKIKMKWALVSVAVYSGYWTTLACLDAFSLTKDVNINDKARKNLTYERRLRNFLIDERVGEEALMLGALNKKYFLGSLIPYIIPYILPVLICIVSAAVMIIYLRKEPPSQQSAITQRNVSLTVLLLTVSFVICFSIPALYDLVHKIEKNESKNKDGETVNRGKEKYVLESTVPLINALLNPVILVWRSSELRRRLKEIFRRFRGRIRNRAENFELQNI